MKKHLRNSMIVLLLSSTAFMSKVQSRVEIKDAIFSEILNENRALKISLPVGYEADSADIYDGIKFCYANKE